MFSVASIGIRNKRTLGALNVLSTPIEPLEVPCYSFCRRGLIEKADRLALMLLLRSIPIWLISRPILKRGTQ